MGLILKLMGSVLIISASSVMGYIWSRDCSKRPQELRTLQKMLQMLETQMNFMTDVICDAFQKVSSFSTSNVSLFFSGTVKILKENPGISVSEAWTTAVTENFKMTSLNKEDREILLSFGKMLGSTDMEGQIKNIRLTMSQLELQEIKAEESKKKNEKMYQSLGILGGIALVIILL